MKLYQHGDIFIFEANYHERHIPRDAGFHWHVIPCHKKDCPPCLAELKKCWWTTDPAVAQKLIQYADAPACQKLIEIKQEKERIIAHSYADDHDIDIPVPDGLAYLPYQKAGIAFALRIFNGVIIADEMGLGKTIQALGIINACPDIHRILVICPASLKINWKREADKWLVRKRRVEIADSRFFPYFAEMVIINYDILKHHHESLREGEGWDMIIVDEGHYLKNPSAQRSKEVYGHKGKNENISPIPARRKLILTGTPIENRPEEIWALWKWIDPQNCPSQFDFMQRYYETERTQIYVRGGGGKKRTIWKYGNPKNLDDLQYRLRSTIMIRRKTEQVLKELPSKRRQIIELPYNGNKELIQHEIEVYAEYKEAVRQRQNMQEYNAEDEYRNRLAGLKELEQNKFAELARIRKELAISKLPYITQHMDDVLESVDKVIVFAYHREVIERLQDHFGNIAVHLYGGMNSTAKQEAVDRFDNDPAVRVFIASIIAAGVGLNLSISSHTIFAEIDYVPGRIEQAEKRNHRIGQERPVLIQFLLFEESLESRIAHSIVKKMEVIDQAINYQIA